MLSTAALTLAAIMRGADPAVMDLSIKWIEATLRELPPLLGRLGCGPTWRDAAVRLLF